MSSLQGFRCRRCRTEVLAKPPLRYRDRDATDWAPPVLCCGLWLSRLPPDQLLPDQTLLEKLPARRQALCQRCGYSVQIVVRPDWPLVCAVCREELQTPTEVLTRAHAGLS